MKKSVAFISILLAAVLLCSCGAPAASSTSTAPSTTGPHGSNADYKAVIEAARDSELNSLAMYDIITDPSNSLHDMVFETYGFVEEDFERYAISAGTVITISYGVFIILPKEGREDAVMEQVNGFVEQQQKAMENYLQDQYEIAKSAVVKKAPTGEILLAMCQDANQVMAKMEAGLAAQ